jgi:predicted secreted protein
MAVSLVGYGVVLTHIAAAVGKVTKINGVEVSHEIIETTSHDSTGGWKEYIQGLLSAGDVAVECDFIAADTGQVAVLADAQAAPGTAVVAWTLVHTASSVSWAFNAFVKNMKIGFDLAGKVTLSFSLAITGAPVLT